MLTLLATTALASEVVLHVGVPHVAGTVYDVAADGATGPCVVDATWLRCPARDGAVRFAWGGEGPWTLIGTDRLAPGERGEAWIVATEASRVDALARLAWDSVTASDVRALFVRYGRNHPEIPSLGMWEASLRLLEHPDKQVRRAAADGWVTPCNRSSIGMYPGDGPCWLPADALRRIARDPDPGVRRRAAIIARDLPPDTLAEASEEVIASLLRAPDRETRQVAALSVGRHPDADLEAAWRTALSMVPQRGNPGLASAATLGWLARYTGPTDVIDPRAALDVVLAHRPEQGWRVWVAWRDHVPFDADAAGILLRETVGWSARLLRHWAQEDPDGLEAALVAWEPGPEHSERHDLIRRTLQSD